MKRLATVTAWGLYSVWQRHARVYQKTWLVNFLPPITEPIVYLVTFGFGLTPIIKEVSYAEQPVGYLQFLAPGMMAIGIMSQAFFEGAYGSFVRLNFQKTWQALLTAPLSFTEVFLGDWLWATTRGMIAGIITGIVSVIWGLYSGWELLLSLPLVFLGSLLFGAMGLLTAGLIRTIDQVNVPVFLLVVPMYTLCGTYFPRTTLPPWLEGFANVLPLSALTDLLRWNLGMPDFWLLDLLWLLVCTGLFAMFAWKAIYPQLFR
jgi:lipooligosaccharide transport system permease protein